MFCDVQVPGEARGVGHRDHVRLLDRVEAGDRGAVETHPALERVLEPEELIKKRLQLAEESGEPRRIKRTSRSRTTLIASSGGLGALDPAVTVAKPTPVSTPRRVSIVQIAGSKYVTGSTRNFTGL